MIPSPYRQDRALRILGLDPGFASIGWAVVELSAGQDRLVECGVLRTEKSSKKQVVAATDDNMRRGKEIANTLRQIATSNVVRGICAESMSFPRNASAAAKVSICWGVIASLVAYHEYPLAQCSPQAIKRHLCGKKDASKEEVAAAVRSRYSNVEALLAKIPNGQREHAYDATAAILACLEENEAMRVLRNSVA